jgi:hypothetical protein
MATSLSFRKRIIRKEGDREVVGKMVRWSVGINPLAQAFEAELKRDNESSPRLRRSAEPEKE